LVGVNCATAVSAGLGGRGVATGVGAGVADSLAGVGDAFISGADELWAAGEDAGVAEDC